MDLWIPVVSGIAAGAASAPHCLAMCGPLASFAAGGARGRERTVRLARHQVGRLVAYVTLGALAGASGGVVARTLAPPAWFGLALAVPLACGMLAMAVRVGRTRPRAASPLVPLGRGRPLAARLLARLPRDPVWIGAISAVLPCGALYSAVLIAASAGSPIGGGLTMLSFALASGVGLGAAGWLAGRWRSLFARRVLAAVLVLGAVLIVARPLVQAIAPNAPTCHSAH